jgi:hypothetical protein
MRLASGTVVVSGAVPSPWRKAMGSPPMKRGPTVMGKLKLYLPPS